MKPVAYEGTEPYIFVSYAHRDSERVFEVLGELQSRGYRFWYDDGRLRFLGSLFRLAT